MLMKLTLSGVFCHPSWPDVQLLCLKYQTKLTSFYRSVARRLERVDDPPSVGKRFAFAGESKYSSMYYKKLSYCRETARQLHVFLGSLNRSAWSCTSLSTASVLQLCNRLAKTRIDTVRHMHAVASCHWGTWGTCPPPRQYCDCG